MVNEKKTHKAINEPLFKRLNTVNNLAQRINDGRIFKLQYTKLRMLRVLQFLEKLF